ncbi:MAG TPA: NAD(P)-dependent methylenetetrahydromethanopterin dehydrogenase [Burkholderiales bacterium]|jgi:methylene-tetrahydromethanopterin dehydrogenase|nr:NAD(P)-dependent methylenetetrahydromethanopterin dehydrogenase [Burkholderiales bacterium]
MEKLYILHMFSPTPNASPFDVNMAYDAGYDVVATYSNVTLDQITALTQDAIFSRGPNGVKRTGIFIGGREIGMAADMMDAARRSMVPPFEVSVFADPSGAFTTAAAMVAAVERELKRAHKTDLKGKCVAVLGGTGPVGTAAAVLASDAGAKVRIASHSSASRARMTSEVCNARYGARTEPAESGSPDKVASLMDETEVVLACAKAGIRVLSSEQLTEAKKLLVAADVNAVPPTGIEGLDVNDDGKPLPGASGAIGIGALAVGNIKYQVQRKLFEHMLDSEKPVYLDFRDAFAIARNVA